MLFEDGMSANESLTVSARESLTVSARESLAGLVPYCWRQVSLVHMFQLF